MAAAATGIFAVGFSPLLRGKKIPATRKYNKPKSTVTNRQSVWSTERPRPPSTTVSEKGSLEKAFADEAKLEGEGEQRLKLKDYFEQSKEMMIGSDGGPPRWFSPLDCASRLGVDGVGLGLSLHHKRLGEMFDIWCLHIPVMDRTPFSDLVDLVTNTVRSENFCSPNRPIYLVGESIGACLALSVAACNPDIDLILILANPATCFGRSQLQPFMPLLQIMPEPLNRSLPYALSFATGIPLKMVMSILDKRYPLDQTVGELTESVGAFSSYLSVLADILPRETLYWKLQMLRSASAYTNSRLHAVKAQTLILSSGRDLLLPSHEEGERLCHMLPKCEIRKFDDSGHALFLEDDLDLVTVIQGAGFYRRARCIDYSSDYIPPTPSEFKKIYEPFRWIEVATSPVVLSTLEDGKIVRGLAGVPSEGPVLFVGYHMLLGWDLVPLISRFWMERNIVVRGIAHPMMFTKLREGSLPELSAYDTFRKMGAVPVSATNFYRLFASKSHVLLFPGGMREALHRKGEEYKLFWPEQSEFVRMAARFGATIIPFGTVGEDDVAEVLLDYDDLMKIPYFKAEIAKLTDEAIKLRADINGEVANQDVHLPVILPKLPGRFYYYFGRPIETKGRKKELRDREKAHELYLEVKSDVEKCIGFLKEKREGDPYRHILPRLIFQAMHGFDSEVPTFELPSFVTSKAKVQ
ncbi:phytyl ester synthase 2, chloroplastic-like isoform X2 [Diospyros lotus]|uniref:phytyl ester synthase 2, chloroplastic-like isoform X2 n=1 Tax=Diospyros lotus TaxID=55363 RepID=UPI00225A6BAB|nr:phytyl ester synthase 2, chloroplastic-like isoform X2 [Diospyros lotus]